MKYAIQCEDVGINVGFKPLLRSVTFSLALAENVAVVGPNGCGKTTLLRCLAGISRPHRGSVKVFDEMLWPTRDVKNEYRAVFLASQPALLLDHSVASNLEFMCNSFGVDPRWADLRAALNRVGIGERESQIVRTLSTGQKRRLTLGALLLLKPTLVFADEPTNGLDGPGKQLCLEVFSELKAEHSCALLIATHDETLVSNAARTLDVSTFARKEKT